MRSLIAIWSQSIALVSPYMYLNHLNPLIRKCSDKQHVQP